MASQFLPLHVVASTTMKALLRNIVVFALNIHLVAGAIRAAIHQNAVLAYRDFSTKSTYPDVNFHFSRNSPPPGASLDLFSARLDGTLTAPGRTEKIQFHTRAKKSILTCA